MLTAGLAQYQYDGRGNLVQAPEGDNVTQSTFDAADCLISAALPDSTNKAYA
jgi:YD repeat-containing protein